VSRHSQKRLKIKLLTAGRIREKQEEKKKGNYFNGCSQKRKGEKILTTYLLFVKREKRDH